MCPLLSLVPGKQAGWVGNTSYEEQPQALALSDKAELRGEVKWFGAWALGDIEEVYRKFPIRRNLTTLTGLCGHISQHHREQHRSTGAGLSSL